MDLLRATGLGHGFDYPLFSGLDLAICEGESVAVQGASGCGKSTLLHILASLLRPQQGRVLYLGRDLYALGEDERARLRRLELGIIFQSPYLFRGFTALENIELASLLSGLELDEGILRELGIFELLGQKITRLSGGQAQRVSIARVLCKRPRLIFADEATGNLDALNAKKVLGLLKDYARASRAGLFFVTHDGELARLCDRSLHLGPGGLEPPQFPPQFPPSAPSPLSPQPSSTSPDPASQPSPTSAPSPRQLGLAE